jgi:ubiquinone/menaquinone biosynthesis C-methylase UbiE
VTKDGAPGWWTAAFRRPYLLAYAHRDEASAEREAAFVASILGLGPGVRLLDAGCGTGRHARAFARRGARVVGLDLSADLLGEARRGDGVRYVLGDVRRLPFRSAAFRHVVSLFTAFGYFDEAGDREHLTELRRVLAPGGTFAIDFLNPPHVVGSLVPESSYAAGGVEVRERRRVREGRVEKDVEIRETATGATHRWTESVRLYDRTRLEALLCGAGFRVTAVHGDLAGGAWSESAPRLVLGAVAA